MAQGYLALLLHAHLPYVRHPEHEAFLEERWFFEAITESYLPLLQTFERLDQSGINFHLTLSISPTLLGMLQDELLQQRYLQHMQSLIGLAGQEAARKHADQRTQVLAEHYLQHFQETRRLYTEHYQGNLVGAFKQLQEAGQLEIITTAATHGFLPLLRTEPGSVQAQLAVAAETYKETFGRTAPGIWLPECGYFPGLEEQLAEQGFRYFMLDTHGILHADERPWHGIAAPLACPNGVAAFGRDPESSRQVWSADEGYPGDSWYREFHQDIGFDRPAEELGPFILDDGSRTHTGIKYFRVTHQGQYKQPYELKKAKQRVEVHAEDFLHRRRAAIQQYSSRMERPPLLLAPYDAELFGHWWYEGPQWLEALIRKIHQQDEIELITPFHYLQRHPKLQCAQPSASSWGELGYNAYWLNEHNDWLYPHLHQAARSMQQLARKYVDEQPGSLKFRALQQAGRSLLLAQASDWPFILKTGTSKSYAEQRVRDLLARFNYLEQSIIDDTIDLQHLQTLEQMDAIFPNLDFTSFIT
ncbi:MAG: 1,4-alpha-glucan branching protein domain-containing protein [Pseudomonadota bacterium]